MSQPTELGYYWAKYIGKDYLGKWEIVKVVSYTSLDPSRTFKVEQCGWEPQMDLEDFEWGEGPLQRKEAE